MNTNTEDKLFYAYGVKPLEKEFANFEKKVCAFMLEQGFTRPEAFIAWQMYKINVKLVHMMMSGDTQEAPIIDDRVEAIVAPGSVLPVNNI